MTFLRKNKNPVFLRDIGQLMALAAVMFLLMKVIFVLAFVPTAAWSQQ